jgi:hypothetical protein
MPVIKWYVNLNEDYDGTRKTRAGRTITLLAKRKFGHGAKRKGNRTVSWTLAQSGPHDEDLDYVDPRGRAQLSRKTSSEDRDGTFYNTLRVPLVGGRTYAVTATKTTGINNVTFNKQYESWRRVYYTLHYMNDACKNLFESIEAELQQIFAGVHIELKPRGKRACIVNEPVSDPYGVGGFTLSNTYDDENPALDRGPHHLRAVLARDLSDSDGFGAHWSVDATSTDNPAKCIGVWSEGTNNRTLVYRNSIAVINAISPTSRLQLHIHAATVSVPTTCMTRTSHHELTVDFTADVSTTAVGTSLNAARKANLRGSVTGRRCEAGFVPGDNHFIEAVIGKATAQSSAVVVGSAKVWTSNSGAKAHVQDPQILLASPGAGDQLEVVLADGTVVSLETTDITRTDEHTLEINLGSDQRVSGTLGSGANVTLKLRRHGALARGPIEAEASYEFDWREFSKAKTATRRKVKVTVAANGQGLGIEAGWLHLATVDPLTLDVETLGAAIDIPATAVSVPSPQKLEIDLGAHVSLQAAAQAMANGGKLTIDGELAGLHAMGGYSPDRNREFIGLTARKLNDDESDELTARRIKLVFCHEIGHALGLTTAGSRNYSAAANEPNTLLYQDEYGGQGSHCSYNAHLQPSGADHGRESTTSGEVYVHAGGGKLCIMYHTMSLSHMGDDFCPTCKAHLRRTEVRL